MDRSPGTPGPRAWADDFDIFDPRYVSDPSPIWAELRRSCPIAHSDRHGPTWLPVNYEDIRALALDTDHFSSRDVGVVTFGRERDPKATTFLHAPPITADPPLHTWSRRMLLPRFGPRVIEDLTPVTRGIANDLLDRFQEGSADAAADYAQHIPVLVIATMLGIPLEDEARFTGWAVRILQNGFHDMEGGIEAIREVLHYFDEQLARREALPPEERPDDIVTFLVEAEHDGAPLGRQHRIGTCFLLLIAGIDTTWSSIGSSVWHLATHQEDQERLRAEPELIPVAVEEFLRFYSPVTMARYVAQDVEFRGCPMREGDKVLMSFPAANRDPAVFEEPDEFRIDRENNRHIAFGTGIHRCVGSNLARMELRIALEELLRRIPPFELADADAVSWSGGQVRGPRTVPIRWS